MKYRVTALTPLLVGDGRELAPIDYMVWKDQVNVLDQPRIFRLLSKGPRLDGYLAQLRRATKLDFATWGGFAQNFSQRRIPFEHPDLTSVWSSAAPESLFIPTFAAGTSGAYLPGSAIKGALRTGFVSSRWSATTIEKLAGSLEGDRLPRRAGEATEQNSGAGQIKLLAAADSQSVSPAAFKIYLMRVASLDTRQPGKPQLVWKVAGRGSVPTQRISEATPIFAEMAAPGTTFSGEWTERTFLENPELTRALGWRSVPDVGQFTEAANKYAAAQLELHLRYAEVSGLAGLTQAVRALEEQLNTTREKPLSCLLSLGWGSGFVSKSAYLDTSSDAYRRILRSLPPFSRAIREGVPFPKTRRVVFLSGQPSTLPGWVTLQLEK